MGWVSKFNRKSIPPSQYLRGARGDTQTYNLRMTKPRFTVADIRKTFLKGGLEVEGNTPQEFADAIKRAGLGVEEVRRWNPKIIYVRGNGFGFHGPRGSVGNVFRGCRAWFNSDDGFDFINSGEAAVAEDCWAFYNGFSPRFEPLADGNGFKADRRYELPVRAAWPQVLRSQVRTLDPVPNAAAQRVARELARGPSGAVPGATDRRR